MKVYFLTNLYPEERCIINKVKDISYENISKKNDVIGLFERTWIKFAEKFGIYKNEKTLPAFWKYRTDIVIHTFNTIVLGKGKWCCTFETTLPRTNFTRSEFPRKVVDRRDYVDKVTIKLVKCLARKNCLKCMALSESAKDIQFDFLDSLACRLKQSEINVIKDKTIVLPPPQARMLTDAEIIEKFIHVDTLQLIFVGHDFFRKGGKQIFDVLEKMSEQYRFHLTVISNMSYGASVDGAGKQEAELYKKKLQNAAWTTYYESLPNTEVMELCKKAHIGLLPTFAETYGYSVLEMQACGCPVISTDIRALTEINSNDCGWICNLPQNRYKAALMTTKEEKEFLVNSLEKQLTEVFGKIFSGSEKDILKKALLSIKRIENEHNPEKYGEILREIYN